MEKLPETLFNYSAETLIDFYKWKHLPKDIKERDDIISSISYLKSEYPEFDIWFEEIIIFEDNERTPYQQLIRDLLFKTKNVNITDIPHIITEIVYKLNNIPTPYEMSSSDHVGKLKSKIKGIEDQEEQEKEADRRLAIANMEFENRIKLHKELQSKLELASKVTLPITIDGEDTIIQVNGYELAKLLVKNY